MIFCKFKKVEESMKMLTRDTEDIKNANIIFRDK